MHLRKLLVRSLLCLGSLMGCTLSRAPIPAIAPRVPAEPPPSPPPAEPAVRDKGDWVSRVARWKFMLLPELRSAHIPGSRAVRDGDVVYPGDHLSIRILLEQPAYVYVFSQSSRFAPSRHYPQAGDGAGWIANSGGWVSLLGAHSDIVFVGEPGDELLEVVASVRPLSEARCLGHELHCNLIDYQASRGWRELGVLLASSNGSKSEQNLPQAQGSKKNQSDNTAVSEEKTIPPEQKNDAKNKSSTPPPPPEPPRGKTEPTTDRTQRPMEMTNTISVGETLRTISDDDGVAVIRLRLRLQ